MIICIEVTDGNRLCRSRGCHQGVLGFSFPSESIDSSTHWPIRQQKHRVITTPNGPLRSQRSNVIMLKEARASGIQNSVGNTTELLKASHRQSRIPSSATDFVMISFALSRITKPTAITTTSISCQHHRGLPFFNSVSTLLLSKPITTHHHLPRSQEAARSKLATPLDHLSTS